MHEKRFPASQVHRLEDPARRTWLPPDDVFAAIGLSPGRAVADVGAGTGYFSLPLAHAVGPHGMVYAVDAQEEMLLRLRQKLLEAGVSNVELIHSEACKMSLAPAGCDLVFAANVWHEFDDRADVLREFTRVLKPAGRIAILDWRTDVAPEPGPPLAHRLDSSSAVQALRSGGFQSMTVEHVGLYSWLVQAEMKP